MNYLRGVIDCIKSGGGNPPPVGGEFTIDREAVPCDIYLEIPVVGDDPCRKIVKKVGRGRANMDSKQIFLDERLIRDFSNSPHKAAQMEHDLNQTIKIAQPGDNIILNWRLTILEYLDDREDT